MKPNTNSIFNVNTFEEFKQIALSVFKFQFANNQVYQNYVRALKVNTDKIIDLEQIPFMPIEFFKTQILISDPTKKNQESRIRNQETRIKHQESRFKSQETRIENQETRIENQETRIKDQESRNKNEETRIKNEETRIKNQETRDKIQSKIFTSSGSIQSKHYVNDISIYEKSYRKGFELFYGNIEDYCVLALLPSYLDREGSSLIYMAEDLINKSKHSASGFYLNNYDELILKLKDLELQKQKTILLGVTYALQDLIEMQKFQLKHTIIMETGGMKGKRREMVREELHAELCGGFGVQEIHSEYGMTELLSQAYSKGGGVFNCPPWMKVLIRDTNDPFSFLPHNKTGGINVIDLANINSCSFIATQDLGKSFSNMSFEVLGRFDNSDIRGCNLLVG